MKTTRIIASAFLATVLAGMPDAEAATPARISGRTRERSHGARVDDRLAAAAGQTDPLRRRQLLSFPQWRWSFSHWRELAPTSRRRARRGAVARAAARRAPDLDAVTFTPIGGGAPMTWAHSLAANYTDGIVVLHRGRIVYERYFGALSSERPHVAFSVTKSFFGTIAATLIAEGTLDANARVDRYIPELAGSGFGDATVAQVLDMTTALDFVENYAGDSPSMLAYRDATGFGLDAAVLKVRIDLCLSADHRQGRARMARLHLSHAEHRRRRLADRARHGQVAGRCPERAHLEPHRRRGRRVLAVDRPARRSSAPA